MPLTLDTVSFSYVRGSESPVNAVEDVTMHIDRGELVLLVGATGSGKSTLMRLAAGLLGPDSGDVRLDDAHLAPGEAGGRVGLIFQDPESQLFADTLLDDVAFGPKNLGVPADEARERAASALADVGLEPGTFGGRSPFSLSGGEARRAAIAGVLAMYPDYLLADEPTAGLDAAGRKAVCELLSSRRQRSGVMVVSHAAEQFLAVADRLIILDEGRIVWSGDASEAVRHPEVLTQHGIAAPEVLEVQMGLRDRLHLTDLSIDPYDAAERIALAIGGVS